VRPSVSPPISKHEIENLENRIRALELRQEEEGDLRYEELEMRVLRLEQSVKGRRGEVCDEISRGMIARLEDGLNARISTLAEELASDRQKDEEAQKRFLVVEEEQIRQQRQLSHLDKRYKVREIEKICCQQNLELSELKRYCCDRSSQIETHVSVVESEFQLLRAEMKSSIDSNGHSLCSIENKIGQLFKDVCSLKTSTETRDHDFDHRIEELGHFVSRSVLSFDFRREDAFRGIVSYFLRGRDEDYFSGDVVRVSMSSDCSRVRGLRSGCRCFFSSNNSPNEWICYSFRRHDVIVTDYSIGTYCESELELPLHPRGWILEGSNDGESWIVLDSRTKDSRLNGYDRDCAIELTNRETYRHIRLRQSELNHYGNHCFAFKSFELFGYVIDHIMT
jgi:hypothetical protein